MSIQTILESYLRQYHGHDKSLGRIDFGASLLDLGLLDSLAFVQLLVFVENEFGVTIDDNELARDNFESIDAIAALVERLKESPVPER